MRTFIKAVLFIIGFSLVKIGSVYADVNVPIYLTSQQEPSKKIGEITLSDTAYGLLLIPNLDHLAPGLHGLHIHEKPHCDNVGMAAGGHLDPQKTAHHAGPYTDKGHLGDLPALFVDKDGKATLPILAPRLNLEKVRNHSLMIHAGGDNYTDQPAMGGGGARIACGVIY